MWKVCKYTLIDLARNRFMLVYTLLLLAISWGLFSLEGDPIKGLLALEQVVLALVPLIAVVFTVTYFHNLSDFTELLAVQPLPRRSILLGQLLALGIAMLVALAVGMYLPVTLFAPLDIGGVLMLCAAMLTLSFVSIGALIAMETRDKARAVGFGLAVWALVVLVYDGLLLWAMLAFGDRPIEPFVVPVAALNPVDLARIMVMLKVDLAAMMGYSGAVYKQYLGSVGGILTATGALALWVVVPAWWALRAFDRKDL